MKTKYQKGIIQITLPVVITIIGCVSVGIAGFYASLSGASTERGEIKTEFKADISQDRERISTLEEAVRTIKEDTSEIKLDIKTLLLRK